MSAVRVAETVSPPITALSRKVCGLGVTTESTLLSPARNPAFVLTINNEED